MFTDTANFTTDTRKQHCPIRIMYCGADPAAGPVHASELTERIYLQRDHAIAIIKATEHSDYSGGSVEASNYAAMQELSVREPAAWPLVQIYGSHGYQALAYDATLGPVPPTEELCAALEGFEDYGIFDDDHHSATEAELEAEAWDDHGRKDFRKALTSLLDDIDAEHYHDIPDDEDQAPAGILGDGTSGNWDSTLLALWVTGCDVLNVNGGSGCVIETGCLVHFYINEWRKGCDDMERTNPSVQRARFQATLQAVAEACRIPEEA